MPATTLAAFLVAALAAAPGAVAAQGQAQAPQQSTPPDARSLTAIYSAEVFQHEVIAMGKPLLGAAAEAESPKAAQDPAVEKALTYDPSSEVEQRTRKKLLDSLLESTEDPATEAEIRKTVAGDDVWLQFHQVLSRIGYSTVNLADVATAYYVITWQVVNGNGAQAPAAGIEAVHDDVVAALAADARFDDLTDADKQEAASLMAYMATIAAASASQLRSSGNQQGLKQLRDQVHKAVLGQGLDLAQLRLTDHGFAAR